MRLESAPQQRHVLVELVDECRLDNFRLLSRGSSSDGLVRAIAAVVGIIVAAAVVRIVRIRRTIGRIGIVGVCAHSVVIGIAMDGGRRAPGRRRHVHGVTGRLIGPGHG